MMTVFSLLKRAFVIFGLVLLINAGAFAQSADGKSFDQKMNGLLNELFDKQTDLRIVAYRTVQSLKKEGEPAQKWLLAALDSVAPTDQERRLRVIVALGELKVKSAAEPLGRLLSDENEQIRLYTASALHKISDKRALSYLLDALDQEKTESVTHSLVIALAVIDDPLATSAVLKAVEKHPPFASYAFQEFATASPPKLDELINLLKNPTFYGQAAQALQDVEDERALNALIELSRDKDSPQRRERGVQALQRRQCLNEPAATDALIERLSDEDKEVRNFTAFGSLPAMDAMGWRYIWRDKRVVKPMIKILEASTDSRKAFVIEALGEIGDASAGDAMLKFVNHRDLRDEAFCSLGRVKEKRAVEPLLAILASRDKTPTNRSDQTILHVAIEALGRIGDPQAFEALLGYIEDPDPSVRQYAFRALGDLGDPRAFEVLHEIAFSPAHKPAEQQAAFRALAGVNDPRVYDLLVEKTKTSDHSKAQEAFALLSRSKDERALDFLINALKSGQERTVVYAQLVLQTKVGNQKVIDAFRSVIEKETNAYQKGLLTCALDLVTAKRLPSIGIRGGVGCSSISFNGFLIDMP